jgi:hypothetical protein
MQLRYSSEDSAGFVGAKTACAVRGLADRPVSEQELAMEAHA